MFYVLIGLAVICAIAGAWMLARGRSKRDGLKYDSDWWAPIMSAEQFVKFQSTVGEYFDAKGQAVEWSADKGMATAKNGAQMGMGNIAQICAQAEESEWPGIISEHFNRLEAAVAQASADEIPPWDQVKAGLTIRLMANEAVPDQFRGNSVWRRDLQGVATMLAIDYPETVATVSRASAVEWGMPDEQLFAHALANLESTFKLHEPVVKDLMNGPLFLFSAEHFFAASHALLLNRMPQCVGPYGAVVAIPTRHLLLCCPVNTFDIVKDIGVMLNIAHKAETDGPGSITNQLYFYRDGSFFVIASEMGDDQQLRLTPPPEFIRVLEELEAAGQEG